MRTEPQTDKPRAHVRLVPVTTVLALLALVLAMAGPAAAGMGKGNGEIGFDIGVTDLDTRYYESTAGGLNLRGGYLFTDLVELEGQLGVYAAADALLSDVTIRTFMVDVVFNFRPRSSIMPYVLVGAGTANVEYDNWFDLLPGPSIDDDSGAFQVGGGSRFFFGKNKKVAVRVEVAVLSEETFDTSSTHSRLTAGFTWRLGK